jgi:hypothetical protein
MNAEEEFWARDLTVTTEEQDLSVRLATEENLEASNDDDER